MRRYLLITLIILAAWGIYRFAERLFNDPVVSEDATSSIDVTQEPRQGLVGAEGELLYEREDGFKAFGVVDYAIDGIVLDVSVNQTYGGPSIYPIDLGLIWGKPAMSNYETYIGYYHTVNTYSLDTNRTLWIEFKKEIPNGWTEEFVRSHISNNHIFPATKNIYRAIAGLKHGEKVFIEGYLVRTEWGDVIKMSSLSRADDECEDLYVKKIQIGEKVYR